MKDELEEKILKWLDKEGYPLEFTTAHKFRKHQSFVNQSQYEIDRSGKPREADVVATISKRLGTSILRLSHVVECKWSKDKPWVLFKNENQYANSALTAQLIGSRLGCDLAWIAAGSEELENLPIFKEKGFAFSGRQAFSSGHDYFYQSVQGVVSNCINLANRYNQSVDTPPQSMLAVILFPMIVVDGNLFEATYSLENHNLDLNEVNSSRVIWNGNEGRKFNTIVDVVVSDYLDEFLEIRTAELSSIVSCFGRTLEQLIKCFEKKTDKYLVFGEGPRGIRGRPEILSQLKKYIDLG